MKRQALQVREVHEEVGTSLMEWSDYISQKNDLNT